MKKRLVSNWIILDCIDIDKIRHRQDQWIDPLMDRSILYLWVCIVLHRFKFIMLLLLLYDTCMKNRKNYKGSIHPSIHSTHPCRDLVWIGRSYVKYFKRDRCDVKYFKRGRWVNNSYFLLDILLDRSYFGLIHSAARWTTKRKVNHCLLDSKCLSTMPLAPLILPKATHRIRICNIQKWMNTTNAVLEVVYNFWHGKVIRRFLRVPKTRN